MSEQFYVSYHLLSDVDGRAHLGKVGTFSECVTALSSLSRTLAAECGDIEWARIDREHTLPVKLWPSYEAEPTF